MSHWWRAHDEALDDPKLQRLPAEIFRAWFNVMCITSRNGGTLPPTADIAFALRTTPDKAHRVIGALQAVGLIDEDETGLHPHNWNARQFKGDVSTERVKRFRKRRETVSGNAPEQNRADIEQKEDSEAKASGAEAPPDPSIAERELFEKGKQLLGKSAGGQIAKLLKSRGGNVALARSIIEAASTKHNPAEYVARVCTGPPTGSPMALKERKKQDWQDAYDDLQAAANRTASSDEGGEPTLRLLPAIGGD